MESRQKLSKQSTVEAVDATGYRSEQSSPVPPAHSAGPGVSGRVS
jgi:hypothetical protein